MIPTYTYKQCTESYNKEILQITESISLGTGLKLIFTARPSIFDALRALGDKSQVFGVFHNNSLAGFGAVTTQERYLNGLPKKICYLSTLRLLPAHRGKGLTSKGFKFLKRQPLGAHIFMASLINSSKLAFRILMQQRRDYPTFYPIGEIETRLIFLRKGNSNGKSPTIEVNSLKPSESAAALQFLRSQGKHKHFFLRYTTLRNLNLSSKDYVAARQDGKIIGLCAIWDQRPFKQIIVKSYGLFAPVVALYNHLPFKTTSNLPKSGEQLNLAYVSHLVVNNNNPDVLQAMLSHIEKNYSSKLPFLAIGLHSQDPLCAALANFRGIKYKSTLFIAAWDKKRLLKAEKLRHSLFYPEISSM